MPEYTVMPVLGNLSEFRQLRRVSHLPRHGDLRRRSVV
jgi:hypothetical protein